MIIALFWCVTTVVFNYAYVGIYVSFLSVPKLKPIISSLEDLPKSHLSWVVPFGTTLDSLFMVGITSLFYQDFVYQFAFSHKNFHSASEGS